MSFYPSDATRIICNEMLDRVQDEASECFVEIMEAESAAGADASRMASSAVALVLVTVAAQCGIFGCGMAGKEPDPALWATFCEKIFAGALPKEVAA
jgi:hypothetical protein